MVGIYVWLMGKIGHRAATGVFVGLLVFMIWGVILLVAHDWRKPDPKHQADQTAASAEAIASAATNAVNTVTGRMTADQEIDAATALALKEIDNAQDIDAVRAAVISAVCLRDSHRHDPACQLRPSDPR